MDTRNRGQEFARLLRLELKQELVKAKPNHSIRSVTHAIGRIHPTLANWLNGNGGEIPIVIVVDVCEVIGIDPCDVVKNAYTKLCADKAYGSPQYIEKTAGRRGRPPKTTK
jgi:hypothetical protein